MVPATLWKPDKVDLLTKLWQKGYTATAVANVMCDHGYNVTRNAVIGKVHRLSLTRDPNKKAEGVKKYERKKATQSFVLPKPDGLKIISSAKRLKGADMKMPESGKRVLLTQTKEGDCRAIIGYQNGLLAEAVCCGETTPWVQNRLKLIRSPWCEYHRNLYVQMENKK